MTKRTTAERLATMESDVQHIKEKIDQLDERFTRYALRQQERDDRLEKIIRVHNENNQQQFSAKWVERAAIWGVTVVGGALLLAGLSLIIIRP